MRGEYSSTFIKFCLLLQKNEYITVTGSLVFCSVYSANLRRMFFIVAVRKYTIMLSLCYVIPCYLIQIKKLPILPQQPKIWLFGSRDLSTNVRTYVYVLL